MHQAGKYQNVQSVSMGLAKSAVSNTKGWNGYNRGLAPVPTQVQPGMRANNDHKPEFQNCFGKSNVQTIMTIKTWNNGDVFRR